MSRSTDAEAARRLRSGIEGLDTALCGGFLKNGLYIIQGEPGAGKTILSNQICYAHAADGGKALYVTLLSEQHERLLANLEGLSFFEPDRVARDIIYVSAFQLLERDGLAGLLTLLRREIVATSASLLVMDGLVAAEAYASSELELKKFVHELQTLAAAADCTMFLLTSSGVGSENVVVRPEHTMVDGIISLHDTERGWRVERDVLVRKFRGSDHLRGRHALLITDDGIKVWPRTESLPLPRERRKRDFGAKRLSTGVAGLDAMLQGGLPEESASIVMGAPGAGKTALGLHFLAGSSAEEPGLWLGFYESPDRLLERAKTLAPGLPALAQDGHVGFLWGNRTEDLIDRIASDLLGEARKRKAKRVVIDGLPGLLDMTTQPDRVPHFARALIAHLREIGACVMTTMELPDVPAPDHPSMLGRLTTIAENLILLRHAEEHDTLRRLISILKLRDSAFDLRTHGFTIEPCGIVVGKPGGDIVFGKDTAPADPAPGA